MSNFYIILANRIVMDDYDNIQHLLITTNSSELVTRLSSQQYSKLTALMFIVIVSLSIDSGYKMNFRSMEAG